MQGFVLMGRMADYIYRQVHQDWNSFYELLKKKKKKEYDKNINIPKYKKGSFFEYTIDKYMFSKPKLKEGLVGVPMFEGGIKVPDYIKLEDIVCIRVAYKKRKIIFRIIYEKEIEGVTQTQLEKNKRTASIDLGVNTLATITFNFNHRPLIVTGRDIKSYNQLYNKKRAEEQSKLPRGIFTSKRIEEITEKRRLRLYNLTHRKANQIVKLLISMGVEQVVVGKNKGWKQNINIGKVNNQNFVSIPFENFVKTLEYKLREKGIFMCRQEESFTSKTNFLGGDFIPTYRSDDDNKYEFTGKHKKRGLYRSDKTDQLIHADVNASFNIMKKTNIEPIEELEFLNKKYIFPLNIESIKVA